MDYGLIDNDCNIACEMISMACLRRESYKIKKLRSPIMRPPEKSYFVSVFDSSFDAKKAADHFGGLIVVTFKKSWLYPK